jgi:ABC-2 type transport system permease protein
VGIGWALFGLGAFLGEFGGLLHLPSWLQDLAPSTHTPTVPAAGASWTGAVVMLAIGVVALLVAGWAFRRRDVVGQ